MSDSEKDYDRDSDHEQSIPPLLADDAVSLDSNGAKVYKYRDYSELEDEEDMADRLPATTPSTRGSGETSIRVQKFPVKLYAILAQKEFHDIISWMPHGRAWKVLKPSMFESLVMPLFFEYSNYHSFNRLVNAWSFRRISSGPDRGAYYHELFLRGKPNLHKYMRRLPKLHKKLPMKKGEEPDFYKMDKVTPLPPLEDSPVPIGTGVSQGMVKQQPPLQGELPLQLGDQRIVTPPRPPQMQMAMSSPAPMAPMIQQPRGGPVAVHGHHGRYPPQNIYSAQQPDVHGGYEDYDMIPLPLQMAPQPSRGPMGHHPMVAHAGAAKMRGGGYGRPMHPAQMLPPSMRQPQGMDLMGGGAGGPLPPSQPYMDQNEYWHHQQQQQQQMQQQMQHMQQLHQMRMYERQQAQLAAQDEYVGYPIASPQRY